MAAHLLVVAVAWPVAGFQTITEFVANRVDRGLERGSATTPLRGRRFDIRRGDGESRLGRRVGHRIDVGGVLRPKTTIGCGARLRRHLGQLSVPSDLVVEHGAARALNSARAAANVALNRGDRERRVIACAEPEGRTCADANAVVSSTAVMSHTGLAHYGGAPCGFRLCPATNFTTSKVIAAKLNPESGQNHGERQHVAPPTVARIGQQWPVSSD